MAVFVRAKNGDGSAVLDRAPDSREKKVFADTPASLAADGPFAPLGPEIVQNDALRAELAATLDVASAGRFRSARPFGFAMLLPFVWLTLQDVAHPVHERNWNDAAIDVAAALVIAWEVTRRAPRRRWLVIALATGAIARVADALADGCYAPIIPLAFAILAAVALGIWLSRVTPARQVAREILDKLDIEVDAVIALEDATPPSRNATIAATAAALLLPALARLTSGWVYIALIIVVGVVTPIVVSRWRPSIATLPARATAMRSAFVGVFGAFGAVFLEQASQRGFDAGAHVLRCRDQVSFAASGAQRQLFLEHLEAIQLRAHMRETAITIVFFVVILPIVEEVVLRGQLQRTVSARFGAAWGLTAGAGAFAIERAMTGESLSWQAVAVGIAFGLTYAEGGVIAAVIAHVLWSAHLLL